MTCLANSLTLNQAYNVVLDSFVVATKSSAQLHSHFFRFAHTLKREIKQTKTEKHKKIASFVATTTYKRAR